MKYWVVSSPALPVKRSENERRSEMIEDLAIGQQRRGFRPTSLMTLLVALVLSATFALSGGLLSGPSTAMAQADTNTTQSDSSVANVAEAATKAVVTITNYQQSQGNNGDFLPQDPNAP